MNWIKEQKKEICRLLNEFDQMQWGHSDKPSQCVLDFQKQNNLLEPEIEFGKVYHFGEKGMILVTSVGDMISGYGFNIYGEFKNYNKLGHGWQERYIKHEATKTEWLEALSKEADRRGYKEGMAQYSISEDFYALWLGNEQIMLKGIWSEIIDEKTDKLEAIQNQINELQKQLNELR